MAYKTVKTSIEGYTNMTEVGQSIEGFPIKVIKDVKTKHKLADFLVIETKNGEGIKTLVLTSNLAFVDWDNLLNKMVCISYQGKRTNGKTGREFKVYEVMVDEEYEDIPF